MRCTTTIESDKERIDEVMVTWSTLKANELLSSEKWILLHGGIAHKDDGGFAAKPCFVLGRKQDAEKEKH